MPETYLSATPENLNALMELPLDGPIVMLNLLKFRPDGGAEEYAQYGQQAAPFLQQAGASNRYLGDVAATVIGGEQWDEAILVDSRLYCMQVRAPGS